MKSWVSGSRLAAGLLALVLIYLSPFASANVGRTVGAYQVSPTGAATYTIPIWSPRGPNGLQPHISLVYSSRQGTGYVGVGWAVAGLSSIYRCNLTYAQDTDPAPVALTTSDGLCLDGQRLRLTSGTADEAGSTYQTEVANFENVTAYETAGNGPGYFVVQAPDGTQYEYGNTTTSSNSQVLASGTATAFQWYLDKVTDTFGNTMTVSYDAATGAVVPDTISWTPTSYGAETYSYTMKFAYGTNADTGSIYAYVAGTPVVNTELLTSITIAYSGNTVKKYALTYQQSPTTEREELTQVEECADSAQTNCLAPTTITYQNGSAGTTTTATSALSTAADLAWNFDFNGDGRNDVAFCTTGSPSTVEVAFATGSGYGTPINTGAPCATALYGDLLGNGQDGIVANNGGTWYYYTWNGSSFSAVSTGVSYDSTGQYVLADVNGDGLADLIESKLTVNSGLTIYARLNASSGSTVSFTSNNALWFSDSDSNITGAQLTSNTIGGFGNLRRLDFNGDGRDDLELEIQDTIVTHGPSGEQVTFEATVDELIASASGFSATKIGFKSQSSSMPIIQVGFLNFNSDACTDLLFPGDGSTTKNLIYVSGCDGSLPETVAFGPAQVVAAMDWNGDGLTDVLVQNGSTLGVYEATGNGLSNLIPTSIPYSASNVYFTFDADGDGLDDLGVWSVSSPYSVAYYLHSGDGQPPDFLSSVTDGYGNFAKPTYVSIAQSVGSTYWDNIKDATYPYEMYLGPIYVVSETTFSDPSNQPNGTYYQQDLYARAWMNLWGRGFAGFEGHQIYDSRNSVYELWDYTLGFPYTGMLNQDIATQNNTLAETIFNRTYNFSDTVLQDTENNKIEFPNVSSSSEEDYEVGGAANGELTATKSGSYSYDNYGNTISASQTVTDNESGNTWTTAITNTPDVDTSTWCLRLMSESETSYTASVDSPSVTRTQDYPSPDLTHCRYTEIQTAPGGSYEVTETLGYDLFGNINSDTVTGSGMTPRVTTANWGTTGQFPMSVTEPDGAADTTQFNYNFSYGLVSSETDPNSTQSDPIVTSWQYTDGFGRLTQQTRPDGTYTTLTYGLNTAGPLARLIVVAQPRDTSGNVITTTQYLSDMLDRPLYRIDTLLSGSAALEGLQNYDSLGRVVSTCAPYLKGSTSPGCATYMYDLLNRVTQVQRLISQSDDTLETTGYDYAPDTITITDPNENTRTLIYDANGWLRQTTDAGGYTVILGYDAAGDRNSVTDNQGNGSQHPLWSGTYAYGKAAFLVGEKDADRGTWGYTVDALGERTAWTDPKGKQFLESYDVLSRPFTRTEPDLFTQWTWGSSAANHNIGKLAAICTGTGGACSSSYYAESETYDVKGRPYQRSIMPPGMATYTYTWQYSATTGLLNTLTYPTSTSGQALELQYAYQNGILQSITDILDSPNVTIWQANAENPAEQITQETLGNGLVTGHTYDGVTHWLSSVQSGPGGGASIQNQSFLYDEVGDVTQRQDNNLGLSENFYYDDDYRLSYSSLNGTQNLSLNYNAMGNITSRSDVASGATWTYDPVHVHEVTKAGSSAYQYLYDANGNVTSRQGSTINWSSYNYPTLINDTATGESVSFTYGPDRRPWFEQTQSSSGTETAYHIGGLLDIVTSGGVTDYRHYIYTGAEPVAIDSRKSSGTNALYYLLSDHQGSIAAITNSVGAVVIGESFTAYGARRNPSTWSGTPNNSDLTTIAGISRHGYTFQDTLGSMGLSDMVGRVQDAITGRFLSADLMIPDPTDPQSYNRYSYTINNPATYTDPSGFDYVTDWEDGNGGMAINGGFGWQNVYTAPTSNDFSDLNNFSTDLSATWHWGSSDGSDSSDPGDSGENQAGLNQGAGGFQLPQSNQPPSDQSLSTCDNGNSPCLNQITVNGYRTMVPDNVFQTPTLQNLNFGCGSLQCVFQMGLYVPTGELAGRLGVYLNLNVVGKNSGKWVQTWVATNANFTTDCGDTCPSPFYTPEWSNGSWFFDDPSRPDYSATTTWLAQVSYLLPNQSSAAFTIQWGFTLSGGVATPISPVAGVTPWASQQQLINQALGVP